MALVDVVCDDMMKRRANAAKCRALISKSNRDTSTPVSKRTIQNIYFHSPRNEMKKVEKI